MSLRKALKEDWESDIVRFYEPPKLESVFNNTEEALNMQIWLDKRNEVKEKGVITNTLKDNR